MYIRDGGKVTTRLVTVTSTAVKVFAARRSSPFRSAMAVQVVGIVDVFVGGSDVAAGDITAPDMLPATCGLYIPGVPDPQSTPPTPPRMIALATTKEELWAVTASGTSYIIAYEELEATV